MLSIYTAPSSHAHTRTHTLTLTKKHASVTHIFVEVPDSSGTAIQFVDEHGFGWGVTQGFYTAVALELQRADDKLVMWRATSQLA